MNKYIYIYTYVLDEVNARATVWPWIFLRAKRRGTVVDIVVTVKVLCVDFRSL